MSYRGLKGYLQAEVLLLQRIKREPLKGGTYLSLAHFVLRQGRPWPRPEGPLPGGLKPASRRERFRNAALLALADPEYVYCEGYGLRLIPVTHAWCLDRDGKVIDPTWAWEAGLEYYGIAVLPTYLRAALRTIKEYGLIDRPKGRRQMLKDPPKLWRHPINDS